jgi:hypothetical protein
MASQRVGLPPAAISAKIRAASERQHEIGESPNRRRPAIGEPSAKRNYVSKRHDASNQELRRKGAVTHNPYPKSKSFFASFCSQKGAFPSFLTVNAPRSSEDSARTR